MRIGIFTDYYLPHLDGVSISVETFRKSLEELGHEVYIFAPAPNLRYKEPSSHIIRFPAIQIERWSDSYASLFFPPQAIRKAESLKFDVIHCQGPAPIGLLGIYVAIKNNIPLITTYHTDAVEYTKVYSLAPLIYLLGLVSPFLTRGGGQEVKEALAALKPSRTDWSEKMTAKVLTIFHNHCDLIIVPSQKMKDLLHKYKTTAPIKILPTGVDKLITKSPNLKRLRKRYSISPGAKVILFIGRLGHEKNIDLLIQAFIELKPEVPEAHLLLVGSGTQGSRLEDEIMQHGLSTSVTFTGYVDHSRLGAVLDLTDVFAFPSLSDTQGLVVNEAAAAGIPLVLVDDHINQVMIDGKTGLIAKNTVTDFSNKLIRLLNDDELRSSMGKAAAKEAAKYTPGKQAGKLLRLYQEVIEKHHEQAKQAPSKNRKSWITRFRDT